MTLPTATRRALQPLWNAFDGVADVLVGGAVLAVSGGPDSRALLEAWARYPRRSTGPVVVVAVDHGLRSAAAAEVAGVVARAGALGLEARSVRLVPGRADEQSLRRGRHDALELVAREVGVAAVVLAHHRADVAEGVLLHLAGQGGGRGGRSPRVIEHHTSGIARVRPFLELDKGTLQVALDALGITDVVVDEDDAAGKNARARLRQRMLDALGDERPAIELALARHARLLRDDDDALEALVPDVDVMSADTPPAILRRWLRRQIGRLGEDPRTAGAAIDDALRLAAGQGVGEVAVRGGTVQIRRTDTGRWLAVAGRRGQSPHTV